MTEEIRTINGIVVSKKEKNIIIKVSSSEKVIISLLHHYSIELGDFIQVEGELVQPITNTTKNLFSYANYLKQNNIFFQMKEEKIQVKKKNHSIYYKIKNKLIDLMDKNPYYYVFLLGDKQYLDASIVHSFQQNGISHLFAISGMHISLISSLLMKLFKKIFSETVSYKIISCILLFYLLILGFSPSIFRGVFFYICFEGNRLYYFYIKKINLFLFVLSLNMILSPNSLFDVGFQFSYFISFTLLMFHDYLSHPSYLISLFRVSLLSFLVSIPISIYHFYQINFLGIIYNLFYVPFVSLFLFPLTFLSFLFPPLQFIYSFFIMILEKTSLFLSSISICKIVFAKAFLFLYIFYFILLVLFCFFHHKKYIILFFFCLFLHFIIPFFNRGSFMKVVDVGQGDAIIFYSNHHIALIDTGGLSKEGNVYYYTLEPLLHSLGITSIDYLILTHGDRDHCGDAEFILENFSVSHLYINDNQLSYFEKRISRFHPIKAFEGLSFSVGDFLFYQLNSGFTDENDNSQVYYVFYQDTKVLLMGDASVKTEKNLIKKYDIGFVDILKVGHHGSRTSTSDEFLRTITPRMAFISSGKDNKFQHPHQEVLEKLQRYFISVYNTQVDGTITYDFTRSIVFTDVE